jgi:hypothetical protein
MCSAGRRPYPGLFAAYNAGPGRYADYRAGRQRLPGETRAYIAIVSRGGAGPADAPRQPAGIALFAVRDRKAASLDREQLPDNDGLFAVDRRERERRLWVWSGLIFVEFAKYSLVLLSFYKLDIGL